LAKEDRQLFYYQATLFAIAELLAKCKPPPLSNAQGATHHCHSQANYAKGAQGCPKIRLPASNGHSDWPTAIIIIAPGKIRLANGHNHYSIAPGKRTPIPGALPQAKMNIAFGERRLPTLLQSSNTICDRGTDAEI
jgi:hypothetical protein